MQARLGSGQLPPVLWHKPNYSHKIPLSIGPSFKHYIYSGWDSHKFGKFVDFIRVDSPVKKELLTLDVWLCCDKYYFVHLERVLSEILCNKIFSWLLRIETGLTQFEVKTSLYIKVTVCTYVPFSRPNGRTHLHPILHRPPQQLGEGS